MSTPIADNPTTLPTRDAFLASGLVPLESEKALECLICFDVPTNPVHPPCHNSHIFCKICLEKWLEKHNTCTQCRTALFQKVQNDSDSDSEDSEDDLDWTPGRRPWVGPDRDPIWDSDEDEDTPARLARLTARMRQLQEWEGADDEIIDSIADDDRSAHEGVEGNNLPAEQGDRPDDDSADSQTSRIARLAARLRDVQEAADNVNSDNGDELMAAEEEAFRAYLREANEQARRMGVDLEEDIADDESDANNDENSNPSAGREGRPLSDMEENQRAHIARLAARLREYQEAVDNDFDEDVESDSDDASSDDEFDTYDGGGNYLPGQAHTEEEEADDDPIAMMAEFDEEFIDDEMDGFIVRDSEGEQSDYGADEMDEEAYVPP